MELAGKRIILGLTGGVACYKGAELARELVKAGASVQAVMTASAQRFVTPLLLQSLTGHPVATTQWDSTQPNAMAHINLSREADAILVAPATADFMARLAQGRCDELLSLLCVARPAEHCGLLLAPAMNREMWAHRPRSAMRSRLGRMERCCWARPRVRRPAAKSAMAACSSPRRYATL